MYSVLYRGWLCNWAYEAVWKGALLKERKKGINNRAEHKGTIEHIDLSWGRMRERGNKTLNTEIYRYETKERAYLERSI